MPDKISASAGIPDEAFDKAGLSLSAFSDLVGLIYQGPLEPIPWQSALQKLRDCLDANTVTLILRAIGPNQSALMINAGPVPSVVTEEPGAGYHSSLDPFATLPPDQVVTVDDIIGDDQWMQSELYKQFLAPINVRHVLGANVRTEAGHESRLRVCRGHGTESFSDREKTLCRIILPHLKRSIQLHTRLDVIESERSLYAGTVDRMLVGLIILDENGAIKRINAEANEILGENDGLHLAGGHIEAKYSQENQDLQKLIRQALGTPTQQAPTVIQALSITRPSGRPKLGVAVRAIPLNEWSEGLHRPAVALFIRDPERKSHGSREVLRRLFSLTPAETSLALQLANGLSLDEAADELGIAKNTARAHLRAIFSKTGVTRQTLLVRVLMNSVASLN